MKPRKHAIASARKYGGTPEDYQDIHDWFDQTKSALPDMRHRMLLHNAFGIFLCEQVFGHTRTNSDGKEYSVRDIGEDHVLQDLGTIPTLERCFSSLDLEPWMGGQLRRKKNLTIKVD